MSAAINMVTDKQLEWALARVRHLALSVEEVPTSAATAPAFFLAQFDRTIVSRGGTYPQIPAKSALFVMGVPTNDGPALAMTIYADFEDFMIYTYLLDPLGKTRLQAREVADAISLDTQWHLLHVEREWRGGDVRSVDLKTGKAAAISRLPDNMWPLDGMHRRTRKF